MDILVNHKRHIEMVAEYVGNQTEDWLVVKKQILAIVSPTQRAAFSRRHRFTKKHTLNDFDRAVIEFWKSLTGVVLIVMPEQLHDPNWIRKPAGWALNGGKERYLLEEQQRRAA